VRFSELDGAKVGVWGAGREIRSFAAQLGRRLPSARISFVASDEPLAAGVLEELGMSEAVAVSGRRVLDSLGSCDAVIRSPGVSVYRDELASLRRRGVPVTTATGLWLAEVGGAGVIGVTGTKGKSTTAALIHHLALAAGLPARLAGNIGVPALDLLDRPEGELAVIELSSYQIADLAVGPEVVVVTNVFAEHTDWHGSFEAYRADKLRVVGLPGVRAVVVNGRDPALAALAAGSGAGGGGSALESAVSYGVPAGWDVSDGGVCLGGELAVGWAALPLRGAHNALNLCAALSGLSALGVALPADLPGALAGFAGLPHRLEVVAERDGVLWVNDSISTTPESTLAALESFSDRSVVLVAGGVDRGQDYGELGRELARRGVAVVGLPVTGGRLIESAVGAGLAAGLAAEAPGMEAAVELARGLAGAGGAVLLSPAAPSFNAYRDFEERGEHFRGLVGA
jgi:UDP-N-acetylmuramoylalanine--D-glutamate ligase